MTENTKKNIYWASRDTRSKYLFDLFNKNYNLIGTYNEQITKLDRVKMFLSAANYFYPDYRKYRQISICCPAGVNYRAKKTEKAINEIKEKIDFIFQFGASYPPYYSKNINIPYFVYTDSCCDPEDETFPWRWRPPKVSEAYSRKQFEIFSNAHRIFTHSKWAKDLIIKVHGINEDKIIIGGSGPILDPIDKRVDFDKKENIVLFVGGDFKRKGVDILRKSLDIVVNKVPNVRFVVIGKNSDNLYLEPHKSFEELGPIYDRKILAEYYSKAKVFVLPSRFEPLGHVLWEAMSFSTPVIVAKTGGMPETVIEGKNGFTFPPENHEILANNIIQIINNDDLAKELSYNARTHYEEKGTWANTFNNIQRGIEESIN